MATAQAEASCFKLDVVWMAGRQLRSNGYLDCFKSDALKAELMDELESRYEEL